MPMPEMPATEPGDTVDGYISITRSTPFPAHLLPRPAYIQPISPRRPTKPNAGDRTHTDTMPV
jgi:hypothetical protein